MKMSELILAVGDDNVKFQNLMNDMHSIDATKRGNKVTFFTDSISPSDLVQPDKCKVVGLVLWLPRDKVDAAVKASNP